MTTFVDDDFIWIARFYKVMNRELWDSRLHWHSLSCVTLEDLHAVLNLELVSHQLVRYVLATVCFRIRIDTFTWCILLDLVVVLDISQSAPTCAIPLIIVHRC